MTTLSDQLRRLARDAPAGPLSVAERKSFLFDPKEAAALDRETVFALGRRGFEQLLELEPSVASVEEALFSEQSMTVERSTLSRDVNDKLDAKIHEFFVRVQPYFLLKPTHQALEWLIYRFYVDRCNVNGLLKLGLPYHETNGFVRLTQVVHIDQNDKHWLWLIPNAETGTPLSKQALINRCRSHVDFLGAICQMIPDAVQLTDETFVNKRMNSLFTFVSSVVVGAITDASSITDQLLGRLIPFLAQGIKSSMRPHRLYALVVVCHLASVVRLSNDLVNSLLKLIIDNLNADMGAVSLSALTVLCQRQRLDALPPKHVTRLIRKADSVLLVKHIETLNNDTDLSSFLMPFLSAVINRIVLPETEDSKKTFLFFQNISREIRFSKKVAVAIFEQLLDRYHDKVGERVLFGEVFGESIRALIIKYPESFDRVRQDWVAKDDLLFKTFINNCSISELELGMDLPDVSAIPLSVLGEDGPSPPKIVKTLEAEIQEAHDADKRSRNMKLTTTDIVDSSPFEGDPIIVLKQALEENDATTTALAIKHLNVKTLNALKPTDLLSFVRYVLDVIAENKTPATTASLAPIKDLFQQISIPASLIKDLVGGIKSAGAKATPKGKRKVAQETAETVSKRWKMVVVVLETFYANTNISNVDELVALLFDLFNSAQKSELEIENRDYLLHLLLGFIAKAADTATTDIIRKGAVVIKINQLVSYIRQTKNPRTLVEALRVLHIATKICPMSVISHIMSIFTFMGSHLYKKDDALAMVMVRKTIDSVVSALTATLTGEALLDRMVALYRLFAGSLADVAEHRRADLVCQMVRLPTQGDDDGSFLYLMVGILLERVITDFRKNKRHLEDQEVFSSEEQFAVDCAGSFSGLAQLDCCLKLLESTFLLSTLAKDSTEKNAIPSSVLVFDMNAHSPKQLEHFRYTVLGWLLHALSSSSLVDKVSVASQFVRLVIGGHSRSCLQLALLPEERLTADVTRLARGLIDALLRHHNQASHSYRTLSTDDRERKYWRVIITRCEIILKKLRALFPARVTVTVVGNLLSGNEYDDAVKIRSLDLLNTKLAQSPSPFTKDDVDSLGDIATTLQQWLSVDVASSVHRSQAAAYSLKLLVRVIGRYRPGTFLAVFDSCLALLRRRNEPDVPRQLVGSLLLCLAELTDCLAVRLLPRLADYVPELLATLAELHDAWSRTSDGDISTHLTITSGVTCLQKTVEQLREFLLPNMTGILLVYCSSVLWHQQVVSDDSDNSDIGRRRRNQNTRHRIAQLRKQLERLPMRLTMEPFAETFRQISQDVKLLPIMFRLLDSTIGRMDSVQIANHVSPLTDLFFTAFDFRSENPKHDLSVVVDVEDAMFDAFLRLSANLGADDRFPWMMQKLAAWTAAGVDGTDEHIRLRYRRRRLITAFRLANKLASELRAIFVLFAGPFFTTAVDLLKRCNRMTCEKTELIFRSKKDAAVLDLLLKCILEFLRKCALYNASFYNNKRFKVLIQPLADLLDDWKLSDYEQRVGDSLADCVAQLGGAAEDDASLKHLNYQLLMKTRANNAKIRRMAVVTVGRLYVALGDRVCVLLPDTIPILSELFEDESEDVEMECQKVIKVLEEKLGEPIQQHFA